MKEFAKKFWEIYCRNITDIEAGFNFNLVAAMAMFIVVASAASKLIPGDYPAVLAVMMSATGLLTLAVILLVLVCVVFITTLEAAFGPTDEEQGRPQEKVRPVGDLEEHRRRKAGSK